ncbi:diguanylate cyclase [Roseococcus sp. SDR]|uniref:sensor domain-containing diguanylate cyclase n=1 Tax=Roseococcus sp. SDR TaxID=2835532 RepID=UPI001BD0593E|nr:GGDEF domain-containing protein [Roseococcus sp. SDR]MBS7789736.1 diguanylate cyclase [Roseococcus sp. SDR]MBV1845050.1 diguanylate cyclase [Roseococcus sp. SDR]
MDPNLLSFPAMDGGWHSLGGAELDPDFRAIVESAEDSVIVTDADLDAPGPIIRYVNPAFTRLTGYSRHEVVGRSPRLLQGPGSDPEMLRAISATLRRGETAQGKVINYGRNGKPYWIDLKIFPLFGPRGEVRRFAAFQRDCTLDQFRLDEMRNLAERDVLTGMSNRRALLNHLQTQLLGDGVEQLCFAYLDIDHFKRVNDTHGHAVGDAVLMGFADTLAGQLRRTDLLGRLGGEEFGVCMPHIRPPEALALAERLRQGVQGAPFATPAGPLPVTCSIGVSMARRGDTLSDLLGRADEALYDAKRGGRNRVVRR